jgi:hypothetical protein
MLQSLVERAGPRLQSAPQMTAQMVTAPGMKVVLATKVARVVGAAAVAPEQRGCSGGPVVRGGLGAENEGATAPGPETTTDSCCRSACGCAAP